MHLRSVSAASATLALTAGLLAQEILAVPSTLIHQRSSSLNLLDSTILFDGPAFPDPANATQMIASIQAFVYLRQITLAPVTAAFTAGLASLGVNIGDGLDNLEARIPLFGAVGLSGESLQVNVEGCSSDSVSMGSTGGLPDLGMMLQNLPLSASNACNGPLVGQVQTSSLDSRQFNNSIFPSPATGFGIISDIDDTIKITDVLQIPQSLENTFLADPQTVGGMPALYSSLVSKLSNPQFIYVSGSPFQLYPFLHQFIADNYPAGPILLQNLTFVDVPGVLQFLQADNVFEYKSAMIDRIHGWYPGKKFLAVGDSTQKDPETYGTAFNKYGSEFMSCIWIRVVEGANNTDTRFSAAFAGVDATKYRLYSDPSELMGIDVAGGSC